MYFSVALVIFLSSLTSGAQAFFSNFRRQPMRCLSTTKPCRIKIEMRHLNGSHAGGMESDSCSCFRQSCPTGWSTPSKMISRSLISNEYNTTMKMMFCQTVTPPSECDSDEESLVLSGTFDIPTSITSYNCRCTDDQPLQLKRRWRGNDFKTYHAYVCSNHLSTCTNNNNPCMVIGGDSVNFECKCDGNLKCRERLSVEVVDDPFQNTYGYCRS